ncbi:MAG: hypothetical protein ACTTKD_08730 [Peptoanaerobacter stomatis]|uniref:hypothetical protein n=1 Tax=Peptoanaerobacter stomatis TaxID=796937 RepID=UPI003F9F94D1
MADIKRKKHKKMNVKIKDSKTKVFVIEREYSGKYKFEELFQGIVNTSVNQYLCKN